MPTLEHRLHRAVNVSVDGRQEMAGFEVSINGRFWVSTEVQVAELEADLGDDCHDNGAPSPVVEHFHRKVGYTQSDGRGDTSDQPLSFSLELLTRRT